ncbi:helix-turn-helix transcriptional regulator [Lentilactobacillus sp. SPB1-3]|uniref:Helix-turn-helix transcriptional regulator n=1 Tax=Lentilactobacillus terminaliae TaxID=3003483 RepID=A0ACD5DFC6_9LACO|nr:hypothetical protein [Lentilactobacillus sp. SPB1-3]MCZ0976358.1 hypothetical protein [Lentilactobacillus sp. SPB1-3]
MSSSMQEYWTMKQIADGLGVNKMRVYRTVKNNNIPYARKQGQTLCFNATAKATIESLITPDKSKVTKLSLSVLKSLNEEIASQQEQIERLTKLLDQSQKLQLLAQQQRVAAEKAASQMKTELKQVDAQEFDSNSNHGNNVGSN